MKKEGTLEQSMMEALLNDRVDAVKVLVENGFTMQTFLTLARLEELYNTRLGPTNTLRHLVQDTKKKNISSRYRYTLLDIGGVIEQLMEGAYRSGYCRKRFKQKYHAVKRHSIAGNLGKLVTTMPMIMDTSGAQELFPHPYHDLLIWAVIMKRHGMAMYLWRQGDEAMAKALVAVKLNKAMAAEADRYDAEVDISDGLRSNAKSFMKLSLELLEHCSKMDDACTQHLLTYELKNFSNQTCMSLAVSGNHRKFVAHRCCQVLLNDMWMGGLRTRKNSSLKVILGILFPPCIPFLEYKTKKELKLMPQTLEEHLYELHAQGLHERNMSVCEELNTGNINEGYNSEDNTETSFQTTPSSTSMPTSPRFSNSPSFHLGHLVLGANESAATDVSGDTSNGFQFPVKKKENQLRLDKKIYEFYNAPITKFWMYAMTYILFLICYTYVVLVRTYPEPKWQEWVVMVYVATTALDKLRSIIASEPVSVTKKLNLYFSQKWNIWDTMMLISFAMAVTLRFIPSTLRDARILYTINIVFWYPRILQIISVNKYLGPYIKIMAKLFIDMCYFTVIMVIVVITFGIVRQSIHFQHEEPSWKLVRNVFFYPYWMIYGELFAHEIDTCYDEDNHPDGCTYGSWVGPAFMCVYLLLIYVLLVNMLIARFNATFIANNSYVKEIWKFQQYMRVVRYKMCPILPAPLVLFSHIFLSVRFLIRRCKGTNSKFENGLKLFLSRKDTQHLHEFESEAVEDYFRQTDMNFRSSQEERVRVINERTELLNLGMDGITQKGQCMKLSLQAADQRMSHLEEISNRTSETLQALKTLLDLGVKSIGANGFASCVSSIEQSLAVDSASNCNSNSNSVKFEDEEDSASAAKSDSTATTNSVKFEDDHDSASAAKSDSAAITHSVKFEEDDDSTSAAKNDSPAVDTDDDISLTKSIDHTGSDVHSDVIPGTEGETELSIRVYDTAKDKEIESDTKNDSSSSENEKHTLKTEAVRVRRVSA